MQQSEYDLAPQFTAEEVSKVKAMLSSQSDRFRASLVPVPAPDEALLRRIADFGNEVRKSDPAKLEAAIVNDFSELVPGSILVVVRHREPFDRLSRSVVVDVRSLLAP